MDDDSSDCSERILLDTTSRTPGKSIGTHSNVLLDVCCERLEGPVAGEGFRAVRHDDDCVEGRVRNGGRLRETSRQVSALTPIILMLGDVPTQLVRLIISRKTDSLTWTCFSCVVWAIRAFTTAARINAELLRE